MFDHIVGAGKQRRRISPLVWTRSDLQVRALNSTPANKRDGRRCGSDRAVRISAVAKLPCEPVVDRPGNILRVRNLGAQQRRNERRTSAMKKHNHSSDDRPIQYHGKYSRHSRGQSLTNFASDRHTGATCLKPSRTPIEALAPAPSPRVSLFSSLTPAAFTP
ncbi:MAG: hypothetical protein JWP25_3889 [Bradyrhizobium sp.]|nr:hypothetical protein [Bradyrhizobium sp.]